jgi:hypothetical protein
MPSPISFSMAIAWSAPGPAGTFDIVEGESIRVWWSNPVRTLTIEDSTP